jgi:hypothetical protein
MNIHIFFVFFSVVILICASDSDIYRFLMTARKLHMINKEYAYISIGTVPSSNLLRPWEVENPVLKAELYEAFKRFHQVK